MALVTGEQELAQEVLQRAEREKVRFVNLQFVDIVGMVKEFADRIHFVHLRNVTIEDDGSFYEAEHLEGGTDMAHVILALMQEETRRSREGRADWRIPMRPDHGHLLADDIGKTRINPGYSLIGRLKGLAELRGIMRAVERFELA